MTIEAPQTMATITGKRDDSASRIYVRKSRARFRKLLRDS